VPLTVVGVAGRAGAAPVAVPSALVELGSALHVLRDPDHHDAAEWATAVRARMSPRLAESVRRWSWTTQAIRATPFVTPTPAGDIPAALTALAAVAPDRLARQLLRPIAQTGEPATALRWARARSPEVAALVRTLVDDPTQAVADFLDLLRGCWDEWFAEEWVRREPTLRRRARRFADTVAAHGAVRALVTLDPAITATVGGDGVSLAKVAQGRHDVSRRGLTVVPSAFIRPHLYVGDVPGQPLLIIHPVEAGPPVPAMGVLVRRLDTMANAGRLEVARAIATEPRTAGEVAALWRLDPTLVTRHLRALAAAGLARPTRRGRFVQYELDVNAVRALGADLAGLLLR
jgi:DNA-binding transcriptional ArsR family regulator